MKAILALMRSRLKTRFSSFLGIGLLAAFMTLLLACGLSAWSNSDTYLNNEMDRLGFGDTTTWVRGDADWQELTSEMEALPEVERTAVQLLAYADYRINNYESDTEGQLIAFDPLSYPYRVFNAEVTGYDTQTQGPGPGEVYVSPALASVATVHIGDQMTIPFARGGREETFTVTGFFEDPFMGSSMIEMKSFLTNADDFTRIAEELARIEDTERIAEQGAMVHVFASRQELNADVALGNTLSLQTSLPEQAEFTYTRDTITGYMLVLQNLLIGFLLAFSLVLASVCFIMVGHSMVASIDQDRADLGVLKSLGATSIQLRWAWAAPYALVLLVGAAVGIGAASPLVSAIAHLTLSSTGVLMPSTLPLLLCTTTAIILVALLTVFAYIKTGRIARLKPLVALRQEASEADAGSERWQPLRKHGLAFQMAVRQVVSHKKRYLGTLVAATLLAFSITLVGRMDAWVGPSGEGLMDHFSVAEHDIGAQPVGDIDMNDAEARIEARGGIDETFQLAMMHITIQGADSSANVISDPMRFHMVSGAAPTSSSQVVLTEFLAADLNVGVGDTVTLGYEGGRADFTVSGLYRCANAMGNNVGMNREGFLRIGSDTPGIWCTHYVLTNAENRADILQELTSTYEGDLHVHDNTWSGLGSIIAAMRVFNVLMYLIAAALTLALTTLTSSKLLRAESLDLGICKALGFSARSLRTSFSLRFALVAFVGAIIGGTLATGLTDPLLSALLHSFGIGELSTPFTLATTLAPLLVVTLLFAISAYLISARIKKVSPTLLMAL